MTLQTWTVLILGGIALVAFVAALVVYGLDYRKSLDDHQRR